MTEHAGSRATMDSTLDFPGNAVQKHEYPVNGTISTISRTAKWLRGTKEVRDVVALNECTCCCVRAWATLHDNLTIASYHHFTCVRCA